MPVYEYRCTKCKHLFERYQAVGEAVPECPKCGSPTRKVYASVGLIFKGTGFHTTDYRKGGSGNGDGAAEKPPAEKASTDKSSEKSSTSASKPATPDTPSKS
jgi:putative FmdB family regulatory protein